MYIHDSLRWCMKLSPLSITISDWNVWTLNLETNLSKFGVTPHPPSAARQARGPSAAARQARLPSATARVHSSVGGIYKFSFEEDITKKENIYLTIENWNKKKNALTQKYKIYKFFFL